MQFPEMLRSMPLIRTNVSEEVITSIIMVTKLGEQGTLAVGFNRSTLRRIAPHDVTSQETAFFIVLSLIAV
jgi:hypothetical protein